MSIAVHRDILAETGTTRTAPAARLVVTGPQSRDSGIAVVPPYVIY
jgi:hypothetical protein